jgi:hypothetical protein
MNMLKKIPAWPVTAALLAFGGTSMARAQLAITQNSATDWKITNGAITVDWDSNQGNIWNVQLGSSGNLNDETETTGDGTYKGLYMDNDGSFGGGAVTSGYHLNQGHYLDWWIDTAASSANAMATSEHFVVFPNDPGVHTYIIFTTASGHPAGSMGQVQFLWRVSQTLFPNTWLYNSGLNNLGSTEITVPEVLNGYLTNAEVNDPGRAVQNAVMDLHGISPLPSGFDREFENKYDYAGYEYLHELQGSYGSTYGCWAIFPRNDTLICGPSKQYELFTGNIVMGEMLSDHLAYNAGYTPPSGASTRIFGPIYYRFNSGSASSMFNDALGSISTALANEETDNVLISAGYTPSSGRGTVAPTISGGGSSSTDVAWAVLGDNETFQGFTSTGYQYWVNENSSGTTQLTGVVPGTYRLSSYVLGQWGEARVDNVAVTAGHTTTLSTSFTPENFSPSGDSPVWTIGTPTRSADKFLHGTTTFSGQGNSNVQDNKEYPGAWNYWSDFASNNGAVVYYATAVGSHGATNNLQDWNYVQWGTFDPGLYAGVYNSSDDTTDGYEYIIPSYVNTLSGHSGTNGVTTPCPPWQVYFTATSAQLSQGSYAILSVSMAGTDGNVTVSLNGHSLTWNGLNTLKTADVATRSGLSSTYQWVVFEWPTSDLAAAGASNEITISNTNQMEYDALRFEISNTSSNPSTRGWHDYEWVNASTYTPADDSVANP